MATINSRKTLQRIHFAKKIAEASGTGQFRHAAVLLRGGSIVNFASNDYRYSGFADRFYHRAIGYGTRHAEIRACLNVPRGLTEGSSMYVVRVNRAGELKLSKPCKTCEETLRFLGIREVYYSTDEGTVEKMRLGNSCP
jgi:tRNA(Arg) A34 adenosine deaminase TadA